MRRKRPGAHAAPGLQQQLSRDNPCTHKESTMIEYISLREVDSPLTAPGPLISIRAGRVVRWNDRKGDELDRMIKQYAANLGVTPDEMHGCLALACVHVMLGR